MTPSAVERAVGILAEHRLARRPLAGLPEDCRPACEADAYAVQERLHGRLADAGRGALIGYKIGCTTPVMQRFLKVDHPCAGGIFEATLQRGSGTFRAAECCRIGVECEIVVRLDRNLLPNGAPYRAADMAPAIGAAMAGIEIVEDRYEDFRALDVWTLAADDFFGVGGVVGEPVSPIPELAAVVGEMIVNGETVGRGNGRDILGDPLEALAWLANLSARRGSGLSAGCLVFLGSLVETRWLEAGDEVAVRLSGLGEAQARVL